MADYIVTGPDGKKYKITADSPEAVSAAAQQMFGGETPATGSVPYEGPPLPPLTAAAPGAGAGGLNVTVTPQGGTGDKEPSLVDRIMSGAKDVYDTTTSYGTQAAAGVREGMMNLAGLPADLVGAIFGIDEPVGGGKSLNSLFPKAPPPASAGQRITRRIGEEIGATAVPLFGAGAKAAQVGVQGARELPFISRMFVEPMAVAPERTILKEATAATAGGTGAGVVGEFSGKNVAEAKGEKVTPGQHWADIGGAAGGYTLGTVGGKVLDTAKTVTGALVGSQNLGNKVARELATDEIVRAAGLEPNTKGVVNTDELVGQLHRPKDAFQSIPGFEPSTADVTGNVGLAAKEYSGQSGPNAGAYAKRREDNIVAVDRAMDANAPNGQPGTFKSALEIERDARIGAASDAARTAEGEAAAAVAPITPRTTRGERGDAIRGEVDTARDVARQATRDAYDAADVNTLPLQPTFLAEALDRTTAGLSQAERGFTPQGLIDRIAQMPAGQPTTLREATSLRTVLLDQQRAAFADPGRRYEARVLGQYIDAVEDVIGQSVSPAQRVALDQARAARRAEADAFELKGDPVAGITARFEGGVPKMRDENVARAATRNDVMPRLLEEADTPATRAAIRDELLSNADTATAAGLHQFQQQYAQQIARFPGLNDELGAAIRARVSENTARGAEGGVLKDIGEGGSGVVAQYLRYGDENAEKAMRAVLAHKDPAKAIDELLTFVGDQTAAVEGARKVFWDIMQKDTRSGGSTTGTVRGNTQPFLPARLQKFLDDPATGAVAARLYRDNPEHLDNVRKIAETLQSVDVRSRAKAPNTSGTAQSVLPSMETVASRAFAVHRGVVSPTFAALNVFGIIARRAVAKQQSGLIQKIVDKALLEPEFAAQLLKENNPANRAALQRRAKGWLGNEASTFAQLMQPDDPDEDVKRAVTK